MPWVPSIVLVPLLVMFVASSSSGSSQRSEGERLFGFWPQMTETRGPTDPFKVMILMLGGPDYPKGAIAVGKVRGGPGLDWVVGDTVHTAHVASDWSGARDNRWTVTFRANRLGSTEVCVAMHADVTPGRSDEVDGCLTVIVDANGVHAGPVRIVREETVRDGQRYRHGSEFLVPIDAPEEVTRQDIQVRARAISEVPATYAECPEESVAISFVVFVDRRGEMRSFRLLPYVQGGLPSRPGIVDAAVQALKLWKFSPATARSRSVADFVIVKVSVRR